MATYDDPRILRAIAHPMRNRILSELHASGSLRAADVARTLDIPANQASFHLRQLAKYGLVEEAPEEARDKRDRVWRMADDDGVRISTDEMRSQPGGEAALSVYLKRARAWGHLLVDNTQVERDAWASRAYLYDGALRLAEAEVLEFAADFEALMQRWRDRTLGHGDDRATYSVYHIVQPYPDLPDVEHAADMTGENGRLTGSGARLEEESD